MFKSIVKVIGAPSLKYVKRFWAHKTLGKSAIVSDLDNKGFTVIPDYINKEQCSSIRSEFDKLLQSDKAPIWRDKECADSRLYFAENYSKLFQKIISDTFVLGTLKEYLGHEEAAKMLLVSQIKAVKGNKGSGGGWHSDSPFRNQLKAIIYLTDVEEENGPFQILPRSHQFLNYCKSIFKCGFKIGQFRFSDREIENYSEKLDIKPHSIVGKAGTLVFADTKCIHRGAPLKQGERSTIFFYLWEHEIPHHFSQYK